LGCSRVSADPLSRLHRQARRVVEEQYEAGAVPRHLLTPSQARAAWESLPPVAGPEVAEVAETAIDGPAGLLRLRVYRPGSGAAGTLLYLHGGGWVMGSIEGTDAVCRSLALYAGCTVVSLDYRLAPEFPFPAAVEDTWSCLVSIDQGRVAGVDPSQPLAVGGMSAGGNLAAVASLLARDAGRPRIAGQLLVVPVLDHDLDRPSYFDNERGLGLERDEMRWFWSHYLPDPERRRDWRASPLHAAGLAGLPPTSIVVAGCDPLRDEALEFAERLHDAGVDVVCSLWLGANHGFFGNERIDAGAMALRAEAERLKRQFARASLTRSSQGEGA
jgi:acetyl esterase